MTESLFTPLGGTFRPEGGCLIPDLRLTAEENRPVGVWGQQRRYCLKNAEKDSVTTWGAGGKHQLGSSRSHG